MDLSHEDGDPFVLDYYQKRLEQFKHAAVVDIQELEALLFRTVESFLQDNKVAIVIGGRAVMRHIQAVENLTPQQKVLLQSFDFDIAVAGDETSHCAFASSLGRRLQTELDRSGYDCVDISCKPLQTTRVIQIGYVLQNKIKYIVDVHSKPTLRSTVFIQGIQCPTAKWLLRELEETMHTESEMKSLKRYVRHQLLKDATRLHISTMGPPVCLT